MAAGLDDVAATRLLDGRDGAAARFEVVLGALTVLGLPGALPGDLPDLLSLVRHLYRPGVEAWWVSRFGPVFDPAQADPQTCAPYPWAHVRQGTRRSLRLGHAAVQADRRREEILLAPPPITDLGPVYQPSVPVPGGCMLCGYRGPVVPAAEIAMTGRQQAAAAYWTPLGLVPTEALGRRRSPETMSGHVCPDCAEAIDCVGSIGPDALERALVVALAPQGLGKLGWGQLKVNGLIGWGAVCAQALLQDPPVQVPPNARPWQHLPDLDALSEQLSVALS